ncbi:MAG: A/G-specific adenine glycosylase, partial [Pseudomonadota bacterium]
MLSFAKRLIEWQLENGRHHLPWQVADPYRIWLSEIMLQQTQVSTVIPYFQRFIERFPDVVSLAEAPQGDVLEAWAGLGYYARARNLHRCAQTIASQFSGNFPDNATTLATLPGIGRSTAAAIAAFGFGERAAILDGNVRRVLCRHFAVEGFPGEAAVQARLWDIAEAELPLAKDITAYTQGLMDLGSMVCTRRRPKCGDCPLNTTCLANRQGQTGMLPTPKPRKTIPQREVAFLLLLHSEEGAQHWLLERRPQQGIWGGLLAPITLAEQHLQAEDVQDKLGPLLPSLGFCFLRCEEAP